MKILFLLRSSVLNRLGGAELQAHYLCRLCAEHGHEVHYAFDSNRDPAGDSGGICYHRLHDYGGRSFSWLNMFAVGKLIDRIQPDVIYQRCRNAYTAVAAYHAGKRRLPMVYNVASDSDCLLNTVPVSKAYILNLITEYAGRYGIRRAHTIITQTKYQEQSLKQTFGRDSIVLPSLCPVPDPPFVKDDPPIVLWIANLKGWKQPSVFLQLAEACRDLNTRFVMAGRSMSNKSSAGIVAKAESLPNVTFLGEIPLATAEKWFSRATLFVNTSLPDEGYPNTYLQAWMRRTPVVALHCDPDNVLRERGLGVCSGTVDRLIEDVRALCGNRQLCDEMGRAAREHAIRKHAINEAGAKYVALFDRLALSHKQIRVE